MPDFLTTTRLLGCDWLRRISSRFLASLVNSSICLSVTAFCVAREAISSSREIVPVLNGEVSPAVLEETIGSPGTVSWGCGAEIAGADASVLLLGFTAGGLGGGVLATVALPSASSNRSRKSASSRPFEGSTWYPDFAATGSAYQAVILALTRTCVPPDGGEVTSTVHW